MTLIETKTLRILRTRRFS